MGENQGFFSLIGVGALDPSLQEKNNMKIAMLRKAKFLSKSKF